MKILPMIFLALISAFTAMSVAEQQATTDPDLLALKDTCTAKGDVTMFVYTYRDQISAEDALELLKRDWNDIWSKNENIPYTSFVDMQRIIRDAYRTDSKGNYVRDCCTERVITRETEKEVQTCIYHTKY